MTRFQDRQMEAAVQNSMHESASSSGPSGASDWGADANDVLTPLSPANPSEAPMLAGMDSTQLGSEDWTGTTATEFLASSGQAHYYPGQGKEMAEEGSRASTSQGIGLAKIPGLAPVETSPQHLGSPFSVSDPVDERRVLAASDKLSGQTSGNGRVSVLNGAPLAEVDIEPTHHSSHRGSSSSLTMTPKSRGAEGGGADEEQDDSVRGSSEARSEAADGASDFTTPARRSRRSAAAGKSYTPQWNKDGTEKKKKTGADREKEKGRSKSRAPSSSAGTARKSPRRTPSQVVIVVSDEEGDVEVVQSGSCGVDDEEAVGESGPANRRRGQGRAVRAVRKGARGAGKRAGKGKRGLTVQEAEVEEDGGGDDGAARDETSERDEEDRTVQGRKRKASAQPQESDDGEDEAEEMPRKSKRGGRGDAEEEEEEERVDVATSVAAPLVLSDASSSVNASKGAGTSAGSSKGGSSRSLVDVTRRFWGKPLKALFSNAVSRSPGLTKRSKIVSLHADRKTPPEMRAAIPVPRSRKAKGEELDSDEERARANETPEERMKRFIREAEEYSD